MGMVSVTSNHSDGYGLSDRVVFAEDQAHTNAEQNSAMWLLERSNTYPKKILQQLLTSH